MRVFFFLKKKKDEKTRKRRKRETHGAHSDQPKVYQARKKKCARCFPDGQAYLRNVMRARMHAPRCMEAVGSGRDGKSKAVVEGGIDI